MRRIFKTIHLVTIMVVILAIFMIWPSSVNAKRGTEVKFNGPVRLDGLNVPAGSVISARINQVIWNTNVYLQAGGDSWYSIDIPMATPQISGGQNGDTVYFSLTINGQVYLDTKTGIWNKSQTFNHPIVIKTGENPDQLTIDTLYLADGVVGLLYSAQLEASGGAPPYMWSLAAGILPGGLALTEFGKLEGVPANAGSYGFKLRVADNLGAQAFADYSITIWKLGDANHDNTVSKLDVFEIIKMYLGILPVNAAADANQDGKIDLRDAVKVQSLFD
jgi:hypothetical protein